MPVVVDLLLKGPERISVPVAATHAAIARRIDADHHAPVKPFTIGPPRSRPGGVVLRVGLLDDALADVLDLSFAGNAEIRLGRHFFTFASAQRVSATRWEHLADGATGGRWTVEFLTPATFRRGGRTSPWPAPESVARGLGSRWRALHPETAPALDDRQARSIWVSDVRGESVAVSGPDAVISGFVGTVTYRADRAGDEAVAFGRLLRFATFGGIGSFTAFGFGQVAVRESGMARPAAESVE
ncbi:CRISPR system precrRNA processing endoribonuclease RAMP protein Cas6 [Nakamurella multipartita]|uniref:CRISPR-associated protein Cas6 C-terminal domain-containing protein n=1 Tax=Nakamurella multipartita (strain ATCC 700099 / DSM 44233 / CIP 104796 / JCM 9543 / NBRC 105858 / Y-104) TaxID=479431 RepID=C8XDH3_NAKMY|nr:CRISPR system precrRNA processing endoribonuclease RAMP protein Cas6 [Nakamurella multipartita]ACV77637.1 hypothetical protein Namu_1232 [Nakamurella multipartita DSM 44233]